MINLISSSAVVGKFVRDFKPTNTAFEADAIEWIAEALDIMHLQPAEILKSASFIVANNRTKIPCDVIAVTAVQVCAIDGDPIPGTPFLKSPSQIHIEDVATSLTPFYQHRGNFFHFAFEAGEGRISYLGLPVDECGYPLVPDNTKVTNAIQWYILMKWLGQGNTHPTFKYVDIEQRWELHYPRAQNDIKHITPHKMAGILRNWVELVPRINRQDDFFTEQQYTTGGINSFDELNDFTGPAIGS